jgi:F-type H+-transporting ATPase subunit delta
VETFIRQGIGKTVFSSAALEITLRFIVLMVRKKNIRHIKLVLDETKKILDKRRGVLAVQVEYVFPLGNDFEYSLKELIKKQSGATRVELRGRVNPGLIGGYRLRIGDKVIDASIRSQLYELETCLAAGITESGDGGN